MWNKNQLNTIQKLENLNTVVRIGEKGNGGAHHIYEILMVDEVQDIKSLAYLEFQQGGRHLENSRHGITDQDLLEIVRDRLSGFCNRDLPTKETEKALEHLEIALMYLNKRTEDRIERQVLGMHKK